jgi:hypothetical protein
VPKPTLKNTNKVGGEVIGMACVKPSLAPHVPGKLRIIREDFLKGDSLSVSICLSVNSKDARYGVVGIRYRVDRIMCKRIGKSRVVCSDLGEIGSGVEDLLLEPTYPYFNELCYAIGGFFGVSVPLRELAELLIAKDKLFKGFFDSVGFKVSVSVDYAILMYDDETWSDVVIDFKKPYVLATYTDKSIMEELRRLDKLLLLVKKAIHKVMPR